MGGHRNDAIQQLAALDTALRNLPAGAATTTAKAEFERLLPLLVLAGVKPLRRGIELAAAEE